MTSHIGKDHSEPQSDDNSSALVHITHSHRQTDGLRMMEAELFRQWATCGGAACRTPVPGNLPIAPVRPLSVHQSTGGTCCWGGGGEQGKHPSTEYNTPPTGNTDGRLCSATRVPRLYQNSM